MRKLVKYQDYNMIKNLESYQIKKLSGYDFHKFVSKNEFYFSEIQVILLLA